MVFDWVNFYYKICLPGGLLFLSFIYSHMREQWTQLSNCCHDKTVWLASYMWLHFYLYKCWNVWIFGLAWVLFKMSWWARKSAYCYLNFLTHLLVSYVICTLMAIAVPGLGLAWLLYQSRQNLVQKHLVMQIRLIWLQAEGKGHLSFILIIHFEMIKFIFNVLHFTSHSFHLLLLHNIKRIRISYKYASTSTQCLLEINYEHILLYPFFANINQPILEVIFDSHEFFNSLLIRFSDNRNRINRIILVRFRFG